MSSIKQFFDNFPSYNVTLFTRTVSQQNPIRKTEDIQYVEILKSKVPKKNVSDLEENLINQTNDLPLYQLEGEFKCKVVDVYDGDTCTIVLINKGSYEKHKLRMYGYDSPEMKPLMKLENREQIKADAIKAKKALHDVVFNKICIFRSMGKDKYGRLLGTLMCDHIHVNEYMIGNGYGYSYQGGKKR